MRTPLATTTLALLLASVAVSAQAQSQPGNWSGGYIGIYGGGIIGDDEEDESLVFDRDFDGQFDDVVATGTGANAFSPGSCDGAARGTAPSAGCSEDPNGVEAGVRGGYDFQFGPIVAGLVGEYGVADLEDSVTSFSTTPAFYTSTRTLQRLAALRGRLGYAFGPALVYGTGGVAYGEITNKFLTSNRANSFTATENDDKADGYQFGGGLEYAVAPGLTIGTEYLYTSLESSDYVVRVGRGSAPATNPFILAPNTAGTDLARSNEDFDFHTVRLIANYRF